VLASSYVDLLQIEYPCSEYLLLKIVTGTNLHDNCGGARLLIYIFRGSVHRYLSGSVTEAISGHFNSKSVDCVVKYYGLSSTKDVEIE
jgi:hypothetical protein